MESSVLVNSIPIFLEGGKPTLPDNGDFKTSEEEGKNIWEELASSHPHLAEELAGRLPAWVSSRKRRGSRDRFDSDSEGRNRELRDSFFHNFPTEFRQYIPSEWGERFDSGDVEVEPQDPPQHTSQGHTKFERQQSSEKATQTEEGLIPNLNQYKLRNTVDLGQKTEAELGSLDAEKARSQRSMSAPPDSRVPSDSNSSAGISMNMDMGTQPQQPVFQQNDESSNKQPNVRHIPIFVEGRDEPMINAHKDTSANFAESRPTPPKEQYFMEHDMPQSFHPTPHFSRAFGSPFKGFSNRNVGGFGPKLFNQTSDQQHPRSKQQAQQHTQAQTSQQIPQQQAHHPQQQAHHPSQQQTNHPPHQQANHHPQHQATHPPPAQAPPDSQAQQPSNQQNDLTDGGEASPKIPQPQHHMLNDPIEKIQSIQRDVLELMSRVEVFQGTSKKDKEYIYLDEMLTRNLIKLDDIETEGKENIRLARKEAIKCIQQCIAVLESQVDKNAETEPHQTMDVNINNENKQSDANNMDVDKNKTNVNDNNVQQIEVDVNNTSASQ